MIEIENIKVPICNVETLLKLKEKSLRPIDQQDVIFLKEKLKQKIDETTISFDSVFDKIEFGRETKRYR